MGIKEIRSRITAQVLHIVYTPTGFKRQNVCEESAILQVAEINLNNEDTFKAHKHLPTRRKTTGTQESWVVVKGAVLAYYYDVNDKLIETVLLEEGSVSVTLSCGHNYKCVMDGTLVYEFKNGPYLGIEKDKVFI